MKNSKQRTSTKPSPSASASKSDNYSAPYPFSPSRDALSIPHALLTLFVLGILFLLGLWYAHSTAPPQPLSFSSSSVKSDFASSPSSSAHDKNEMARLRLLANYSFPPYLQLDYLFTDQEIESIVSSSLARAKFEEGKVGAVTEGTGRKDSTERRSRVIWLIKYDREWLWVYERILFAVRAVNDEHWQFSLPDHVYTNQVENMQFAAYYGSEEGHYDWHTDTASKGPAAKRRLSVTVQLSQATDYEGGDLEILDQGPTLSPSQMSRQSGTIIVFNSQLFHRVKPVTKGVRYSLVQWYQEK